MRATLPLLLRSVLVQVAEGPNCGIIVRAVRRVFAAMDANAGCESHVKISFLEIYNEKLDDLLAAEPSSFMEIGKGVLPRAAVVFGRSIAERARGRRVMHSDSHSTLMPLPCAYSLLRRRVQVCSRVVLVLFVQ